MYAKINIRLVLDLDLGEVVNYLIYLLYNYFTGFPNHNRKLWIKLKTFKLTIIDNLIKFKKNNNSYLILTLVKC